MEREVFLREIHKMVAPDAPAGEDTRAFWREGDHILATAEDADFAALLMEDIREMTGAHIPEAQALLHGKNEALIVAKPKYCLACIEKDTPIYASLDDMAQIVGYRVPIVNYTLKAVTGALNHSAGVLIRPCRRYPGGAALTAARDPYEAYVAMTVLKKAAEVSLKAEAIGGARPLEHWKALLERRVYLNKYSKTERKRRNEKR